MTMSSLSLKGVGSARANCADIRDDLIKWWHCCVRGPRASFHCGNRRKKEKDAPTQIVIAHRDEKLSHSRQAYKARGYRTRNGSPLADSSDLNRYAGPLTDSNDFSIRAHTSYDENRSSFRSPLPLYSIPCLRPHRAPPRHYQGQS